MSFRWHGVEIRRGSMPVLMSFSSFNHGSKLRVSSPITLKATTNCLCGSVGDAGHYVFACPLTKDFYLVSLSQNAKKASFRSIVRNASIHSKLKPCIKIASTIRDQIS
ncbi:hypothetical protein TNCV_3063751 [Trichonephila clavipes]|nr:hypothetical protein TNCV_3063751 [Trichonephila clavipes]